MEVDGYDSALTPLLPHDWFVWESAQLRGIVRPVNEALDGMMYRAWQLDQHDEPVFGTGMYGTTIAEAVQTCIDCEGN